MLSTMGGPCLKINVPGLLTISWRVPYEMDLNDGQNDY